LQFLNKASNADIRVENKMYVEFNLKIKESETQLHPYTSVGVESPENAALAP